MLEADPSTMWLVIILMWKWTRIWVHGEMIDLLGFDFSHMVLQFE